MLIADGGEAVRFVLGKLPFASTLLAAAVGDAGTERESLAAADR
ncbi:MAG: hypothetical protein PHI18_07045 [bacterium]|nr:hypothetical protein [bacterium]